MIQTPFLICLKYLVVSLLFFMLNEKQILIKSISYNGEEIIGWILKLHCNGQIELDPTYSKGNFYKGAVEKPKYKFDLCPQIIGVEKANAEKLPLGNGSISTIMFDPPFLATKGKSLSVANGSNKINKRFGVYPSEKELHIFYKNAMTEFYRILKPDGILIFKCQDKVSSGTQYFSHNFIMNEAGKIGFYTKDMSILLAKQRDCSRLAIKEYKTCKEISFLFPCVSKKTIKRLVIYNNGICFE